MKTALVLGGGEGLWRDVERALRLGFYDVVVACNDAASVWPGRLDAAVSLHADRLAVWLERRSRAGLPRPANVYGHEEAEREFGHLPCFTGFVPYRFDGQDDTGSSGHFALKVALTEMGADRAVLCGVPMAPCSHFFDAVAWTGAEPHKRGWLQSLHHMQGRAKSMSGWTAELLGEPTTEWLRGEPEA